MTCQPSWWWTSAQELSSDACGLLCCQLPVQSLADPNPQVAEAAGDVLPPYGSIQVYFAGEDHGIGVEGEGFALAKVPGLIFGLGDAVELDHLSPVAGLALCIHVRVVLRDVLLNAVCLSV